MAVGGLIAYGPDLPDQYRHAATYVDRILKGEKPSDLPVQAPTKFALTVNLKAAKALGLAIPPGLLAGADAGRLFTGCSQAKSGPFFSPACSGWLWQ